MGDSNRRRARSVLAVGLALLVAVSLSATALTYPVGDPAGGSETDPPVRVSSAPHLPAPRQQTTTESGPAFDATVFKDIAGQVATEDGVVPVRGTATGTDSVLVVLFDRRGRVVTELLSVNDSDVFEEEDLELVTDDGTPLAEGRVVATVLSPGRDGVVGDGEVSGVARADLADFEEEFLDAAGRGAADGRVTRTQQQLVELYYDQTIEDSGSDDLLLAEEFVYTDGRTTIERVVPQSQANRTARSRANRTAPEPIRVGDTMVVAGLTNRRPDDSTVFVEVVGGPSAAAFDLAATQTWGTDGAWSVAIEVPDDAEPGTYRVEAEDGDDAETVRFEIRPRGANETAEVGVGGGWRRT
ncbi:hypothetical protein [Halorussus caseinilyticus]|uniref:hypothetical protein n=1 Tax=Halorussus caseinilyticus TaxID=3034025 RepID=UPI0023E7B60A|nr:hypothetical protein [Halorussus sp. DT72]